jgi:hypothetical protein
MKKALRFGKLKFRKSQGIGGAEPLASSSDSPLGGPLHVAGRFPLGPPPEAPPPPPTYHFAMKEYKQTLAPLSSNDDGRAFMRTNSSLDKNTTNVEQETTNGTRHDIHSFNAFQDHDQFMNSRQPSSNVMEDRPEYEIVDSHEKKDPMRSLTSDSGADDVSIFYQNSALSPSKTLNDDATMMSSKVTYTKNSLSPSMTNTSDCYHFDGGDGIYQQKQQWAPMNEPNMPDATYEETYGDAYCGGPIKYIYPSGYHGLRPRSGPWKLSVLVFLIFMWLSIFIVGYCADLVDISVYQGRNGGEQLDDDVYLIETRWCGSRFLYFLWAISISITGLAAAYCSIIGYVQVRDVVVANSRSQPPGMMGKSDYYVKLDDMRQPPPQGGVNNMSDRKGHNIPSYQYDKTIYQADGTPQFWGGHIYRPTQAAVAVTSR